MMEMGGITLVAQEALSELIRLRRHVGGVVIIAPSPISDGQFAVGFMQEESKEVRYMSGAYSRSDTLREFKTLDSAVNAVRRLGEGSLTDLKVILDAQSTTGAAA